MRPASKLMLAAVLASLSAFPVASQARTLKSIKALIPIPNFDESFAPVAVAKANGYFEEEGLDVTLIPVKGSNEVAIQISAGNADVGLASPADAIIGMQSGKDLDVKFFYNLYYQNIWPISVPAGSPIKSVAELRGKKIGVLSMGSTGITFGRAYLKEAGLDPKDASFLPIGAGAQALTAVKQGLVDGLLFNDSALAKFDVQGLATRSLPISDKLRNLPDTSMLAKPDAIRTKREELVGFARAIAKGYHFTITNPAAAVKITWKLYPEAEPKNVAAEHRVEQGVAVAMARMKVWQSAKTNGVDGAFIDDEWRNLVTFLKDADLMKEDIPNSRIYTTEMLSDINAFDRGKVVRQAQKD